MADTNKARDKPEEVQQISLSQIHPFPEHPFQVRDDELMQQTIDSIQQVGILTPVILRPDADGGFEMISGHRRLYAAGLAGLDTIPAIVRNMSDDEAIIFMVDSNLQREKDGPRQFPLRRTGRNGAKTETFASSWTKRIRDLSISL